MLVYHTRQRRGYAIKAHPFNFSEKLKGCAFTYYSAPPEQTYSCESGRSA